MEEIEIETIIRVNRYKKRGKTYNRYIIVLPVPIVEQTFLKKYVDKGKRVKIKIKPAEQEQ